MPGFKGNRTRWWKSHEPNDYFDATCQAIIAARCVELASWRGLFVAPTLTRRASEGSSTRARAGTAFPSLALRVSVIGALHFNTHLTPEQSVALRRVTAALDQRLARLSNSQRVVNACGALKYLLEQIGAE